MNGFQFYTYVHTRNDTGEVFYIGKGKGSRAFAKGRNPHWNNIVNKHGYTVHIVAYWETEELAFAHEKELITEFRALGVELANMTDGGEGSTGWIPSEETRKRIGDAGRGRKHSAESCAKMSASRIGRRWSESKDVCFCEGKVGTT